MSGSATQPAQGVQTTGRSPLERLLHGLNQPLTGLQCSMEVALASPRSVEYYVERLRDGLALTERMRALVEAMREVVDVEAISDKEPGDKPSNLAASSRPLSPGITTSASSRSTGRKHLR